MLRFPREGKKRARRLSRYAGSAAASSAIAASTQSHLAGPFGLFAALMGALSWTAKELAEDPPRVDWESQAKPVFRDLDVSGIAADHQAFADAAIALNRSASLLGAGVVAFERGQGALLASERAVASLRVDEAASIIGAAAETLEEGAGPILQVVTLARVATEGVEHVPVPDDYDFRRDYPHRLSAIPTAARRFGLAAGLAPTDFNRLIALLNMLDPLPRDGLYVVEMIRDFAVFAARWEPQISAP